MFLLFPGKKYFLLVKVPNNYSINPAPLGLGPNPGFSSYVLNHSLPRSGKMFSLEKEEEII
jgi:hypothetical protein